MTLFGRQTKLLVFDSSNWSRFSPKTIQGNLSVTLEGPIHKIQCSSAGILMGSIGKIRN